MKSRITTAVLAVPLALAGVGIQTSTAVAAVNKCKVNGRTVPTDPNANPDLGGKFRLGNQYPASRDVFAFRLDSDNAQTLWACWRSTGRKELVASTSVVNKRPAATFQTVLARGEWLLTSVVPSGDRVVEVLQATNVRTGRRGIRTQVAVDTSGRNQGPVPLAQPNYTGVLLPNGQYAWVTQDEQRPGELSPAYSRVYAAATGGPRLLDQAPAGSIGRLKVSGTTVSWTVNSTVKSQKLP